MQNPPPGPPPGGQPPYQPPGGQQPGYPPPGYQAGGIDKKTGAVLSYLLWWVTGIVFLFVGKNDPDVKFHAAQSTIFFGSITIVWFVLNRVASFADFTLAGIIGLVEVVIWLFAVVIWIIAMLRANSSGGARFPLPLVGGVVAPYADQLANAVT